jgi:PelA/Pel-15E family pectate lyase
MICSMVGCNIGMQNGLRRLLLVCLASCLNARAQERKPGIEFKTSQDFLALHVSGRTLPEATALQYRLAEPGELSDRAAWSPVQAALREDGAFQFDLPLPQSRWSALEVRAMKGEEVLASKEAHPRQPDFEMLTPGRIAIVPESQREAWTAYMKQSAERARNEHGTLAAECRKLGLAHSKPAPSEHAEPELHRDAEQSWWAGSEAGRLADAVISYQTPTGGWSKAVDYAQGPRQPGTHWTMQSGDGWHYCGTLDNRSTTEQIKFLARVYVATGREDAKAAALHGIDWLFEAQFPNGGWPQNYPVEPGYHEAITLNDDAMVHALEVLLDIAEAGAPFAFADEALRRRARAAFDRGIACLLAAQVKVDGKPTVWCAQHAPLTLVPVAARKKEPASLSGGESTALLKFLMRRGPVSPAVIAAVEPAIAWLEAHRITGLRKAKNAGGQTDFIADAGSPEVYWARFYDVETARPMFAGSQDGMVYATFGEMAANNRVGYDYYTTKPGELIGKELGRWKKRIAQKK